MTLGAYDRPRALTCAKTRVFAGTARSSWSDNALERRRDQLARIIERERDRRSIRRITVGRQTRTTGWSYPRTFYRRFSSRIIVNRIVVSERKSRRIQQNAVQPVLIWLDYWRTSKLSRDFTTGHLLKVFIYQYNWRFELFSPQLGTDGTFNFGKIEGSSESSGIRRKQEDRIVFFRERTASSIARQSSRNRDWQFFSSFLFFFLPSLEIYIFS